MRPTSEQIDRGILDAAARVFATHGYAKASVQQIADEAGYSKTGLLHRFPTKQALHAAVLAETRGVVESTVRTAADLARPHDVLELVAAQVVARPGLAALLLESLLPASGDPGRPVLIDLVHQLVTAVGAGTDPERRFRAVLALKLVVDAAAICADGSDFPLQADPARLQHLIVELAEGVLGTASKE